MYFLESIKDAIVRSFKPISDIFVEHIVDINGDSLQENYGNLFPYQIAISCRSGRAFRGIVEFLLASR